MAKKLDIKPIANTAKAISEKATDITKDVSDRLGLSKDKASIKRDVDEVVEWAEKRNKEIAENKTQAELKSMPTLAKVVFGGKDGMEMLSEDDREKYSNFFKANGSRLALLTVINPTVGIGAASIELAASGIVTNEMANASIAAGAGIVGASALASGLASSMIAGVSLTSLAGASWVGYSALSALSGLTPIGLGVAAVGAGAHLFNKVNNTATGKKIAAVYDKTFELCQSACDEFITNTKEIEDILLRKLGGAIDALEEAGKKAAISVDDIVHNDQNLRIMQYQEIILNQQIELEESAKMLALIKEQYNKQVLKNQELSKQIAAYQAESRLLACSAEYLK